jgi:hypothetical protein
MGFANQAAHWLGDAQAAFSMKWEGHVLSLYREDLVRHLLVHRQCVLDR